MAINNPFNPGEHVAKQFADTHRPLTAWDSITKQIIDSTRPRPLKNVFAQFAHPTSGADLARQAAQRMNPPAKVSDLAWPRNDSLADVLEKARAHSFTTRQQELAKDVKRGRDFMPRRTEPAEFRPSTPIRPLAVSTPQLSSLRGDVPVTVESVGSLALNAWGARRLVFIANLGHDESLWAEMVEAVERIGWQLDRSAYALDVRGRTRAIYLFRMTKFD